VARELVFMRPEVEALELEGYAALRGVLSTYACLLALPASQFERLLAGNGGASSFRPAAVPPPLCPTPQGVPAGGGEPIPFRKGERAEWYYRCGCCSIM
jgi:dGTPase